MDYRKINEMSTDELSTLRDEVEKIANRYGKALSDYEALKHDPFFNAEKSIKDREEDFKKHRAFTEMLITINNCIEKRIYDEYIKD